MLIDSHCHLFPNRYGRPTEQLIKDTEAEGVTRLICIGTSLKENKPVLKAVTQFDNVYGAIGIYPHDNMDTPIKNLIPQLETQITSNKKIVAIGECGIDITDWHGGRKLPEQLELFEKQIQLAIKLNLPVVIHNRNGEEQVLALLKEYVPQGLHGVIHCFVSNWEFGKKILDLGFYLSFAGNITYPSNRQKYTEILENIPNDRFLVETDSPYLPPQGYRGQVNEPKYVKIVAEKVSEIKKISFEKACEFAYNNATTLFKLIC